MRASLLILLLSVQLINSEDLACKSCKFVVSELEKIFEKDLVKECIQPLISFLCERFHIQTHNICKGITSTFKEEFLYVIKELISKPQHVCGLLLKDCDHEDNPLYSNWTIPIPGNKPQKNDRKPPKDTIGPTLRVLHITDLHIDLEYAVGTEVDCGEPMCCRWPKERSMKPLKSPAGYWGSVGNCDSPLWTVENMLKHASTKQGRIDYIVVAGDLESHADWEYSKEGHLETINILFPLFNKYFPRTPLYFSLGNHEGYPVDNVAPHSVPEKFQMTWLYDAMLKHFGRWLTVKDQNSFRYNACFSTLIAPKLRLISLNSILGDNMNFFLYLNQTDPDGTMTWFASELLQAEKRGEKVQILAHLPAGAGEMFEQWAINYYRLVNRFEDTIVGQFVGHTHKSQVYLTFEDPEDATSRPTSVSYSGPSATPYDGVNPGYRIYTIDGVRNNSTYKIIDFADYYLDLIEANANYSYKDMAPWKALYTSVKKEYNMASLEPEEWMKLVHKMPNDHQFMRRFEKNVYRRDLGPCDAGCVQDRVCQMVTSHHSKALCQSVRGNIEGDSSPSPPPRLSLPSLRSFLTKCPV
ncbi:unnamed protein product [Bursaphelenchus xylophilus]|uniref:Sphingomyelin phosphodiesterase n=1 Tax=Bursaphelenchus xylophilus TaxID=6326 RepID=A0A1I7SF83_BURXY|nr:unnamed protein product [Bursaphelenchus xylophilus]CAG9130477.1 unnamed protein product [Bursaphelenchus xylophilus]